MTTGIVVEGHTNKLINIIILSRIPLFGATVRFRFVMWPLGKINILQKKVVKPQ